MQEKSGLRGIFFAFYTELLTAYGPTGIRVYGLGYASDRREILPLRGPTTSQERS